MEYNFREIEKKWQKRWVEEKTYQVTEDDSGFSLSVARNAAAPPMVNST